MDVPFLRPAIEQEDIDRMVASIRSGWLAPSRETREFEETAGRFLGAPTSVMTASCTAALHMGLMLAGVEEGDEVITTPLSYVATSNTILYQRARPVFVDVDPRTGLIDLDAVEAAITDRTRAIMPVHLYGLMVDMLRLNQIAASQGLAVIEDAAHAFEAERGGVRPGETAFAAFSFHVAKNLTSGQGGLLASPDPDHGGVARAMRRDGVVNIGDKRVMTTWGYKYDATDFQAAMLIGQLTRVWETHKQREAVFQRYRRLLADVPGVDFPDEVPGARHASHMFVVWVAPEIRDSARARMAEAGVETSIHYLPIHLEPYYRERFGFNSGSFPVTEDLGSRTITLPTYAWLSEEEQEHVVATLAQAVSAPPA